MVENKELYKDIEEKDNKLKKLTKKENSYNDIEKSDRNLQELEATLKMADKFTMRQIINYLTLDSYEIVKNMAKVVNNENASQVLSYRDWALQRNEELKKFLSKFVTEKKTMPKL